MIRWTKRDENGRAYVIPFGEKREYGPVYDTLAELEDKLESGVLIDNSKGEWVKVVRCKDCRFRKTCVFAMANDDPKIRFCGYGEAKEKRE